MKIGILFILPLLVLPFYKAEAKQDESLIPMLSFMPKEKWNDRSDLEMTDSEYEEIHKVALENVGDSPKLMDKALSLMGYVYKTLKYDTANAKLKPIDVLHYKTAICQGYSNLYKALALSVGIPNILVNGYLDSNPNLGHAWNYVLDEDGTYKVIDSTNNRFFEDIPSSLQGCDPTFIMNMGIEKDGFSYSYYNGVSIKDYVGSKDLEIPSYFNSYPVVTIEDNYFTKPENISSIFIPSTVESIISNFSSFNELEKITVDDNNSSFFSYDDALYNKNDKTVIKVPNKIIDLELYPMKDVIKGSVYDAPLLESVVINEGSETIEGYAFEKTPKLKKIVLPSTIKNIEIDAFPKNPDLTIYAENNSYVEEYCKENGIKFSKVDSAPDNNSSSQSSDSSKPSESTSSSMSSSSSSSISSSQTSSSGSQSSDKTESTRPLPWLWILLVPISVFAIGGIIYICLKKKKK